MGEALTTYTKDYRKYPGARAAQLVIPLDIFAASQNEDDYLPIKPRSLWDDNSEELIRRLFKRRMQTEYMVQFNCDREHGSLGDVMYKFFDELYKKPKTRMLLPPLPTSRRVNGYSRHADYYMPATEYQETVCRQGFNIFKKDFENGVTRLGDRRKHVDIE